MIRSCALVSSFKKRCDMYSRPRQPSGSGAPTEGDLDYPKDSRPSAQQEADFWESEDGTKLLTNVFSVCNVGAYFRSASPLDEGGEAFRQFRHCTRVAISCTVLRPPLTGSLLEHTFVNRHLFEHPTWVCSGAGFLQSVLWLSQAPALMASFHRSSHQAALVEEIHRSAYLLSACAIHE